MAGRSGTKDAPIRITAADPKLWPIFSRAGTAIHLSDCRHVELRQLNIRNCTDNGINIDDGGKKDGRTTNITIKEITVEETGPAGNHDALKLSGVDHFTVDACLFHQWGGSAIDMVGCHDGQVFQCSLIGGDSKKFTLASGIQVKGGSARILISHCVFNRAGQRAVNIGGSTGLEFFRPNVTPYEAKDVTVSDSLFIGSLAPIAWVNSEGGTVEHNLIVDPGKWVARILQETRADGFHACRNGGFKNNVIVFNSKKVSTFVNVGDATAPETFQFRGNAWFQNDLPEGEKMRTPGLPVLETDGVYGIDPEVYVPKSQECKVRSKAVQLKGKGPRPLKCE